MPSKEEKKRRRKIVQALAAQERAQEEASMPLSKVDLRLLLEHLEEILFERRADGTQWCYCDHTLKRTRAFLLERQLNQDEIIDWLEEYGGFCDCEVSANVGGTWADRVNDG